MWRRRRAGSSKGDLPGAGRRSREGRILFYKLNKRYALRGWQGLNCALVSKPYNQIRPLAPEQFRVLLLCDGRTELDRELLSQREREALDFLLKEDVISGLDAPDPVSKGQEYRRYHNRQVDSVFWSITGRCNYRCRHCYMDAPDAAMGELSHEQAMDLIDQFAKCGIFRADLTGGEPLVRADFWELVDAMRAKGMTIGQIYTNGWLVDDALLDKFEARRLRPEFSISFDGVGWHDWMRGVKGAEEAALCALRLCVTRGFPVNVEMCLHRGNAHTLRETVKLLAGIGVPMMKVGPVSGTELWRKNAEGNEFSNQDFYEAAMAYIPQFYEDGCPMEVLLGGVIEMKRGSGEFRVIPERYNGTDGVLKCHLCGAVRHSCYITPDGRLLPCIPMTSCKEQELFPKIEEIGLQKGLSDSFYMKIADSRVADLMEANEKCRECEHVLKCGGGCRASALMCSGDVMGADEDQCMMWREGWVDRIRQAAEDAMRRFPPKETKDGPEAG